MANLEQSESRILDAWSVKLTFSQKLKTELKNLENSSHTIVLSKGKTRYVCTYVPNFKFVT